MWRLKILLCLFGETRRLQHFLHVSWYPSCSTFIGVIYNIEIAHFLHLSCHCISFLQFIAPLVGQDEFKSVTLMWCQAAHGTLENNKLSQWLEFLLWFYKWMIQLLQLWLFVVKTWELYLYNGQILQIFWTLIQFIYKVAVLPGLTMQFLWVLGI